MPAKAAYCREQARLAQEVMDGLLPGDPLRVGFQRVIAGFNALADHFDRTGETIPDDEIAAMADALTAITKLRSP